MDPVVNSWTQKRIPLKKIHRRVQITRYTHVNIMNTLSPRITLLISQKARSPATSLRSRQSIISRAIVFFNALKPAIQIMTKLTPIAIMQPLLTLVNILTSSRVVFTFPIAFRANAFKVAVSVDAFVLADFAVESGVAFVDVGAGVGVSVGVDFEAWEAVAFADAVFLFADGWLR